MYSRQHQGRPLTLGHTTDIARGAFIFYDLETESLWVHGPGEAIEGPLKGMHLQQLPGRIMKWRSWKHRYPDSTIVRLRSEKHGGNSVATEHHGLSVTVDDDTRLYPFSTLQKLQVINDTLGTTDIVVVYTPDMWLGAVYERGERTFRVTSSVIVDETGRPWDMLTGTSGTKTLKALPAIPWLTERWSAFYQPDSVYSVSGHQSSNAAIARPD